MKANDYITRHEAIRALQINSSDYGGALRAICKLPTADVAPVVHGRWEKRGSSWYCTRCGIGYRITYGNIPASRHKYCPRCGVRMDGKDGGDNEATDV